MNSEEATERCAFKGCSRPQYDEKTRMMHKGGESWRETLKERPICYRHWLFQIAAEEGPPVLVTAGVGAFIWWLGYPLLAGAMFFITLGVRCYQNA